MINTLERPSATRPASDSNPDDSSSTTISPPLFFWHEFKNITLLNDTCRTMVKVYSSGLMTKWKGTIDCGNGSPEVFGYADSKQMAVMLAIENYLKTTGQSGSVTYEQLEQLTKSYSDSKS
jgi:hypothetical protein